MQARRARRTALRLAPAAVFAVAAGPGLGAADSLPSALPEACETALALEAAPEHLRSEAGIYVWSEDGYRQTRESTNGFTCIVNRDDPYSIKPTCFDAEGSRTIVPKILFFGQRLAAGDDPALIHEAVGDGFENGRFVRPARPGVAYMLSHYNRPWDRARKRLGLFPPHLMFYAPDLSNRDIGFAPETYSREPHLPFIGYAGPHGYMIVRIEAEARPDAHPIAECPGWLVTGRPDDPN